MKEEWKVENFGQNVQAKDKIIVSIIHRVLYVFYVSN